MTPAFFCSGTVRRQLPMAAREGRSGPAGEKARNVAAVADLTQGLSPNCIRDLRYKAATLAWRTQT
eukprot:5172687-Heterocapsa_arctica.AAC.1